MSKKAMKLALEALEHCKDVIVERGLNGSPEFAKKWGLTLPLERSEKAITTLREALAEQPAQQEPVISTAHGPWIPSTHPGEEGESYCKRCLLRDKFLGSRQCDPHIVPTPAAQQEPVVWMYVNKSTHETKFQKHMRDFIDHSLWSEVPLYGEPLANHELQCICGAIWLGDEMVHLPDKRPPAQRTWVGLVWGELPEDGHNHDFLRGAVWAEAKLKEKNT